MIKTQITNYKTIQNIVLTGDLFRLLSPYDSNFFCEQIVSKDKTMSYVVGLQITNKPFQQKELVRLKNLQVDGVYFIQELDFFASGSVLMNKGIPIPKLKDFEGWHWHIIKK